MQKINKAAAEAARRLIIQQNWEGDIRGQETDGSGHAASGILYTVGEYLTTDQSDRCLSLVFTKEKDRGSEHLWQAVCSAPHATHSKKLEVVPLIIECGDLYGALTLISEFGAEKGSRERCKIVLSSQQLAQCVETVVEKGSPVDFLAAAESLLRVTQLVTQQHIDRLGHKTASSRDEEYCRFFLRDITTVGTDARNRLMYVVTEGDPENLRAAYRELIMRDAQ